jgi:flagellar protein FlgJ
MARRARPPRRPSRSLEGLHPAARRAAARAGSTGIPATFMIAQAAHEIRLGQARDPNKDGSNAHNLFGIKAGGELEGQDRRRQTTEVHQRPGRAR